MPELWLWKMLLSGCMILCFTGNGKGKTTAAIGVAVRAKGHGKSVSFFKFMKGIESGEDQMLRKMGIRVELFGGKGFVKFGNPSREDVERARKGLAIAMHDNSDVVVLDEAITAVYFSLLQRKELEEFARPFRRNEQRHVVMTGRGLWQSMEEMADLVTEMKKVKHYFDEGFLAFEGLDL